MISRSLLSLIIGHVIIASEASAKEDAYSAVVGGQSAIIALYWVKNAQLVARRRGLKRGAICSASYRFARQSDI